MPNIELSSKDHLIALFMATISVEDLSPLSSKMDMKKLKATMDDMIIEAVQREYGGVNSREFKLVLEEGAVTPFIIAHQLGMISDERLNEVRKSFIKSLAEAEAEEKATKESWLD